MAGPGRPKKHPAADLHFQPASTEEPMVAVEENPTTAPSAEIQENPEVSTNSMHYGDVQSDAQSVDMTTISPIEEKIQQLIEESRPVENVIDHIDENGWHIVDTEIVIQIPPRNGTPIRVSETVTGEGILAFWRRTRAFANATRRWSDSGKWVDFSTGLDLKFVPKYWKPRHV